MPAAKKKKGGARRPPVLQRPEDEDDEDTVPLTPPAATGSSKRKPSEEAAGGGPKKRKTRNSSQTAADIAPAQEHPSEGGKEPKNVYGTGHEHATLDEAITHRLEQQTPPEKPPPVLSAELQKAIIDLHDKRGSSSSSNFPPAPRAPPAAVEICEPA